MDILAQLLSGSQLQANWGPTDDRWYQPTGTMTESGERIDAEGAQKISAWFRGRDLLATAVAMLPLQLMERLPDDGGSEPARSNPLYDVLHLQPNDSTDSFTWRWQKMYDLIDGGWSYDWMPKGSTWNLERIDPALVRPELVKSGPRRGRWLFHIRDAVTSQTTVYTQDEVFFLRRADGRGILDHARESLGLSRVTENYAGKIYSHGFLNAGVIEVPGVMKDDQIGAMARSFKKSSEDWHLPSILPFGAKMATTPALTPEKAQMLLSRAFTIDEMARWLGVPRMMLENSDPSFGNAEQFNQNFVAYSLGPWLSLFEFGINAQLIAQGNRFFAEFTRDALIRGNVAERWQAYQIAISTGTYTRNEVRRIENKKKLPGLDTPLDPAHLTGKPTAAEGAKDDDAEPAPKPKPEPSDQARAIVVQSAARLLRKEITAVEKQAVKLAADQDLWAEWVTAFYDKHASLVAETLQMTEHDAREYCAGQAKQLLEVGGLAALANWGTETYARSLAALALDEAA